MSEPGARYARAVGFAATAHAGQVRKGTQVPYITHPVAVSELVARYGGDEDQMIAGLLHDVLEDCPQVAPASIAAEFGARVLEIVRGCTDTLEGQKRGAQSWRARKEAYIAHVAQAHRDTALVSACDKLHNARSIVADLTEGLDVFSRFNRPRAETAWYYEALAAAFSDRGDLPADLVKALGREVEVLARGRPLAA